MWYNPLMKWLLQSPLHGLVSGSTMLLTFRGRKSGRMYTTPVSYLAVGDALYTISSRDRVWWRNLRGGAEAELRVRGEQRTAQADVFEDQEQVARELTAYLQAAPQRARYLGVGLRSDGMPEGEDVRRLAEEKVVVKWQLGQAARGVRAGRSAQPNA